LAQREDIAGSQDITSNSDDDAQNASVKDEDSMTNVTSGEDELSQSGAQTPQKKVKKRKEGSEHGSAKKKARISSIQ
jgi:hypothetical protein